jgi:CHAD domain-containing protein
VAYSFERDEPVAEAVTRIMEEQIARARDQLTDPEATLEKRIHDARKRFKETRALLRLVHEPLGARASVEDAWFRDAGRDLAGARDADAVIEALEKLASLKPIPAEVLQSARRSLKARRGRAQRGELDNRIANVVEQMIVPQARLGMWPRLDNSFDTIATGLGWSYRRGRQAMDEALKSLADEDFHEWRKRVKEHWYHAQLLRALWPAMMKSYASALEELSRALGDHHDLAVLRGLVTKWPEAGAAIDERQKELESAAAEIGGRVYAERPGQFLARMRNYWSAWRTT